MFSLFKLLMYGFKRPGPPLFKGQKSYTALICPYKPSTDKSNWHNIKFFVLGELHWLERRAGGVQGEWTVAWWKTVTSQQHRRTVGILCMKYYDELLLTFQQLFSILVLWHMLSYRPLFFVPLYLLPFVELIFLCLSVQSCFCCFHGVFLKKIYCVIMDIFCQFLAFGSSTT